MITITALGEYKTLKLIIKQLYRLVDVIEAKDRSLDSVVIQELAMIKCKFDSEKNRGEILHIANSLQCTIVDISNTTVIHPSRS
jgi:acetolactate synthase small subunit